MSYTINVDEDDYKKLEELHRNGRDPSVQRVVESILEKNNKVKDGNIIYKQICNHFNKISVKDWDYDIEFDGSVGHQDEDVCYVCTDCWTVWGYFQGEIGTVTSEEEVEAILKKIQED